MKNLLRNKTFAKIRVGQGAELTRVLKKSDIELFGLASGDFNPAHFNVEYAKKSIFKDIVAHGMWTASLISAVLGTKFPGPGTIYLGQSLKFLRPVRVGDKITVKVTVIKKYVRKPVLILLCKCTNQHDVVVLTGYAKVLAPTQPVECEKHTFRCHPEKLSTSCHPEERSDEGPPELLTAQGVLRRKKRSSG